MSEIENNKPITIEVFNKLEKDDGITYELVDGVILMSPRPNYRHQEIMSNLNLEIGNYLKGKPCKSFTEVELELEKEVIIPDISVICGLISTDFQRYNKAPTIVIEILSPISRYVDTFTKLYKYEIIGVREYWIVNPKKEMITIYNFENKTNIEYSKSEILKSIVFNDLEIDLSDIF